MTTSDGPGHGSAPLRLAEVLAPLSLVTDLGMGLPDERAMRACLLATALAREMGLPDAEVSHVYYTTLLEHLGCTATATEEARHVAGDQLAMRSVVSHTDEMRPGEMLSMLAHIGEGRGPVARARTVAGMIAGFRWGPPVQAAVCEVATLLAERLGLPVEVRDALGQVFERWDGKGAPRGLRGDAIAAPARVANVASRALAFHELGGPDAAIEAVQNSSGGWLDPGMATTFATHGHEWLASIADADALAATLDAEPEPRITVPRQRLDEVARAFGDMVDLLSPHTLGHSSGVAEVAQTAGEVLGLSMAECVVVRRAALLHDLGRAGVPAGAWSKRGPLTASEWERVRLHPYYTERILVRVPALQAEAQIAGMHHERLDGGGYHRGSAAREQPLPARILAAADAYQAMRQPRSHRPALGAADAADRLAEDARAGRLDGGVVEALLSASGERRQVGDGVAPAGLSEREIEVLRLVAAGCSNPEIAERLVISRRTAEHHVQHVYAKIGVSTRPGATLFALEHDLIPGRG
jgi:HD-GYP domain-containing protein (c-di-GMP phosphodiesterase class II)